MTIINTLTMASLFSFYLAAYGGDKGRQEAKINTHDEVIIDPTSMSVLTITKVKKPYYTWRGFVIKKMIASIPEYQSINGLKQKFYSFTDDNKLFGGIYFWETEKDAKNWFNQAWYDRTEKKYGKKGIVDYYKIESTINFRDVPTQNGKYFSVLSLPKSEINIVGSTEGILKKVILKNSKNETFYLTIWVNKGSAKNFFKDKNWQIEYFDTPIFLNNIK